MEEEWEQIHIPQWNIESLQINNHFPQSDSPIPPPSSSSSSPTPPPESPPPPPSPTSSKVGGAVEEEDRRPVTSPESPAPAREIAARLRVRIRILVRKLAAQVMAAGRLWSAAATAKAVVGVVAAFVISVIYRRWRRRRALAAPRDQDKNRLVLLLREKDEKISRLMIRIAEMNEALSARRRVPVIRVG